VVPSNQYGCHAGPTTSTVGSAFLMNRRYFPLAAPARMSAQRAAAATPPAIAAAPARAAAVPVPLE